MADPVRSNILSDTGERQARELDLGRRRRGRRGAPPLRGRRGRCSPPRSRPRPSAIGDAGGAVVHQVASGRSTKDAQASGGGRRNQAKEPFGFADGVSQPIIRGTRRWMQGGRHDPHRRARRVPARLSGQSRRPALAPWSRPADDPHNLLPVVDPRLCRRPLSELRRRAAPIATATSAATAPSSSSASSPRTWRRSTIRSPQAAEQCATIPACRRG